jgi:hypothetical protein
LDTTKDKYMLIVDQLKLQAKKHLKTIVYVSSEYTKQNLTVAPCCPRGVGDDLDWGKDFNHGPWKNCVCTRINE